MRIVFYSDRFSENMGYNENVLPASMAARGHDVYLVTSTMQVYGDSPFYDAVYGQFLGPSIVGPCRKALDGFNLVRLPILCWWKRFRLTRGAVREVLKLKPDIVQTFDPRAMSTLLLSVASRASTFKLFTSEHSVASVYPAFHAFDRWPFHQRLYLRLTETLLGWVACRPVVVCYAPTPDAGEIAVRFHGVDSRSVRHLPLGVDTSLFRPVGSDVDRGDRARLRKTLGVDPDDILCIYSGRFTNDKNPLCLARAIELLRATGRPFRGLFLGRGEQAGEIMAAGGCRIMPFVPYPELGGFFRASDIGVWPCQESISMLDAAACGLPIVVGDKIKARERVDGNGMTYAENDPASLADQLARLADPALRSRLGGVGVQKARTLFGLDRVVDIILKDYETALGG